MRNAKTVGIAVMAAALVVVGLIGAAPAVAGSTTAAPGWAISSLAQPSNFSAAQNAGCEHGGTFETVCDSYTVQASNVGASATDGSPVTIVDKLPAGMRVVRIFDASPKEHEGPPGFAVEWDAGRLFPCTASEAAVAHWTVTCTYRNEVEYNASAEKYEEGSTPQPPVAAGDTLDVGIEVAVEAGAQRSVLNQAEVEGGGAPAASTSEPSSTPNTVEGEEPSFGLQDFSFEVLGRNGQPDSAAGEHPWALRTGFQLTSRMRQTNPNKELSYEPIDAVKDVVEYLPLGLIGDPLATPRCAAGGLRGDTDEGFPSPITCKAPSMIGSLVVNASGLSRPSVLNEAVSGLYNITPESGFPAQFGAYYIAAPVFLHAAVVPLATPTGYEYALRVSSTDIPNANYTGQIDGVAVTMFGSPAERNGGGGAPTAFLRNPTACGPEPLTARIEVDSWQKPRDWISKEAEVYPGITGCDALQFNPDLEVQPETHEADTPSGYEVDLTTRQALNVWPVMTTPDLKQATVVLPQGVDLSPSAGTGLQGCTEAQLDPLGTEEGPDGLLRAAPGHCPLKSQIGTVELETPLLEDPLKGHIYVAQPGCGGAGQAACTKTGAEDGNLYGIYLEMGSFEESGVIIKLKGKVHVDPTTGKITTTFDENPQLPFEELKLDFSGGQRAALANPQTCGTFTTTSDLEPWSAPESGPNATPSWPFSITGCKSPMPFSPSFEAGTAKPLGGEFSPFVLTLKRADGEQDIGGVDITMPPGLAGMLSKVPLCGEPQAEAGTCSEASRIGTAHVASGAGSLPLWLEGRVYITGKYKGDPFGLSVVVPAKAGPYNLGNEVVRSGISVNPRTAQVSVSTPTIPQIKDGVPFRIKEINVDVNRSGFMFNPTNCEQLHLTGSVSGVLPDGTAGSTVAESEPFALAGCKGLPFKPIFKAETHAFHSRKHGAYLHVHITSAFGQANIAKVHVQIPAKLPARNDTLKLACTEEQFDKNPEGCPEGSIIGHAVAHTPVLPVPLEGKVMFVSHGSRGFPDVEIVLKGDGVTEILEGQTFINKKGQTFSTFGSVPDVPVSSFDMYLPEGPHSALAGTGNLCRSSLFMPTTITGQNGAVVEQRTKIHVAGCKPQLYVLRHEVNGDRARIHVQVPSGGKLVVAGHGIERVVKHVPKAKVVTVTVHLNRHYEKAAARRRLKIRVKVNLRFAPKHGKALHAQTRLLMR